MKKTLFLIFCSAMMSCTILAQDFSGSMTSFGGGLSFTTKTKRNTGFNVFFNLGGALNKNIAMRGELVFHYVPFSYDTSFTWKVSDYSGYYPVFINQSVYSKTEGSGYGITARFDVLAGNFTNPTKLIYYGAFGFGFDLSGGTGDSKITYDPIIESQHDYGNNSFATGPYYNFCVGLGGGVGYRISSKAAIVLELRAEIIQDLQYYPLRLCFTFLPPISE